MTAKRPFVVYMLASKVGGTIYVGATNDLVRRCFEHSEKLAEGFTEKYDVHRLVYFESFKDPASSIQREKRLKKWNRRRKIELLEKDNPDWLDLYPSIASP
jgi:putative endonuclease